MARFILIILLFTTFIIVVMNFVLGFFRRLLGFAPAEKTKGANVTVAGPKSDLLYRKDGVEVLKGDSEDH